MPTNTHTHTHPQVFTVLLTVAEIGQSDPRPFSINTLTLTLSTNLPLVRMSAISIYPLEGASVDPSFEPGYDPETNRVVSLRGELNSTYASVPCAENAEVCQQTGLAEWRPETRTLVMHIAEAMLPGPMYQISWTVRNPGRGQQAPLLLVEVGVGASRSAAAKVRFLARDLCVCFGYACRRVYICMCVVHVCMYVCMCVVHVCMYVCMCVFHVCMYVRGSCV